MDIEQLSPRRPYILRAFYDWLLDNNLTPHLVVDATLAGVQVPMEFVVDGQIVLNIAPQAIGNLELGNDDIRFSARFSGRPHVVIVPLYAAIALYARENGAGTMFEPEPAYDATISEAEELEETSPAMSEVISTVVEDNNDDTPPDDEPPRPQGRPSLRLVK